MQKSLLSCHGLKAIVKPVVGTGRDARLCSLTNLVCSIGHITINRTICSSLDRNHSEKSVISEEVKEKIFNTKLWQSDPEGSRARRKLIKNRITNETVRNTLKYGVKAHPPISLKYLENPPPKSESEEVTVVQESEDVHFPFSDNAPAVCEKQVESSTSRMAQKSRHEALRLKAFDDTCSKAPNVGNWLSDYEQFKEEPNQQQPPSWKVHYGTPSPNTPVSKVPCGGCGAKLQCKEPSIPGYLPSEVFIGCCDDELKGIVCQRCHFLKHYNIALDVTVSAEEYPMILSKIKGERAAVILMVDLLDFPCSIWPGIMDIIGTKRPVVIVGNKVDLIPGDHGSYLSHLQDTLLTYVQKMGLSTANIKHVAIISAHTGFGVEDLITNLHQLWNYKSDVYLVGCTNVGKSTLFNMLLQSDFCKVQAVDLVQRATTSIWPGTTLNLLKFPILRPEGWRQAMRFQRLKSQRFALGKEAQLRKQQLKRRRLYHMPSLMEYVGRTFYKEEEPVETADMFSVSVASSPSNKEELKTVGFDETAPDFAQGRWCYDTPGVMHPEQILNLLTTEELIKAVPRMPIKPRFFTMKPGKTLFLGGLGRIDYLEATNEYSTRFAVFSSDELPVTITSTADAEFVYKELLGSDALAVPCGGPERISLWPGLLAKDEILQLKGSSSQKSCGDIVLSSAGWVSITPPMDIEVSLRVWTPAARGIYLRQPSLLPYAIAFKGKRIEHTPIYRDRHDD